MTQMERREAVAQKVREAMKEADVNDSALARATGIPRPTLRRKVLGERDFTFTELVQVAIVLSIPSEELFAAASKAVA